VLPIELSAWLRTALAAAAAAALDEFEVDAAAHVVVGGESVDEVEDVVLVVDEEGAANEIWGAGGKADVVAIGDVVAAPVVEGSSSGPRRGRPATPLCANRQTRTAMRNERCRRPSIRSKRATSRWEHGGSFE
jgi:hypothetical protein